MSWWGNEREADPCLDRFPIWNSKHECEHQIEHINTLNITIKFLTSCMFSGRPGLVSFCCFHQEQPTRRFSPIEEYWCVFVGHEVATEAVHRQPACKKGGTSELEVQSMLISSLFIAKFQPVPQTGSSTSWLWATQKQLLRKFQNFISTAHLQDHCIFFRAQVERHTDDLAWALCLVPLTRTKKKPIGENAQEERISQDSTYLSDSTPRPSRTCRWAIDIVLHCRRGKEFHSTAGHAASAIKPEVLLEKTSGRATESETDSADWRETVSGQHLPRWRIQSIGWWSSTVCSVSCKRKQNILRKPNITKQQTCQFSWTQTWDEQGKNFSVWSTGLLSHSTNARCW